MRPTYRKVKKAMRSLLGTGLDDCLEAGISVDWFGTAIRTGLKSRGVIDTTGIRGTDIPRKLMPSIRVEDAVQDLEKARKCRPVSVDWTEDRVTTGRVAKPSGRAASRSKSPAKSPTKRERDTSVSRPVRARSQSPKKAAARTPTKSPAPNERPRTRSRSPSEVTDAQPTDTGRKGRSKSPAKAPIHRVSKSPVPVEKPRARTKSPSKVRQPSSPPLEVAKTRSRSPAKAKNSQVVDAGRTRGTSKSPEKKDSLYQPTNDDAFDEEDGPGK